MSDAAEVETFNDQMVGINGGMVIVLMPKARMTPEEAMRHAAWLVANAEVLGAPEGRFERIREAVNNT